ncbi:hypothetical protein [Angustibacter peucedani]
MSRQFSPTQAVVLSYRYFHLFFVLQVAFGSRFQLATHTEQGWASRPITEDEARTLLGGETLEPPLWRRFGLLIALAAVALVLVVAAVVSSIGG